MREMVYALRFNGYASAIGTAGGLLRMTATAPGLVLTTTIGRDGLAAAWHGADGDTARLDAEITLTSATTYQEIGTLTVGEETLLCFSSIGSCYLRESAGPVPGQHGVGVCHVDRGEGPLAHATGIIVSNIFFDSHLAATDYHVGILFLPEMSR